jgi:hypothetical protein
VRDPPYWKERDCPTNYAFEANSTQSCLDGRTIYIIGVSTARQFGFSTIAMMGGEEVSRQEQMLRCSKMANREAESCCQTYNGVTIKDLFLNYLDGFDYSDRGGFSYLKHPESVKSHNFGNVNEARKFMKEDHLALEDSCSYGSDAFPSVHACLEKFFEGSKPQGEHISDRLNRQVVIINFTPFPSRVICRHLDHGRGTHLQHQIDSHRRRQVAARGGYGLPGQCGVDIQGYPCLPDRVDAHVSNPKRAHAGRPPPSGEQDPSRGVRRGGAATARAGSTR